MDKKLYDSIVLHYGQEKADELVARDKRRYRNSRDTNSIDFRSSKSKKPKKTIRTAKKRKRAEKRRKKRQWALQIVEFAEHLEQNLPKSEVWFRELYSKHFIHKDDKFNKPLNISYIPDVSNRTFKYIIEIDGNFHQRKDQMKKDQKKDMFYKKLGYSIFRLQAYNEKQYIQLIDWLVDKRDGQKPTKDFNKYKAEFSARSSFINQGVRCSNNDTAARAKPKAQN